MSEVSCRACDVLFAALEARGVAPERLAEGSRHPIEHLRSRRGRVEWDEFVRLLERATDLGGKGMPEIIARSAVVSRTGRVVAALGRLAWTERQLWGSAYRRLVTAAFPHVEYRCEALPEGRLRVRVEIPGASVGSVAFLEVLGEFLRVGPRLLGRCSDALVQAEISSHRAVYVVTPPPRPALRRFLRWLLGRVLADRVVQEFDDERRAIAEAYEQLQLAHRELARSADALRESERRFREIAEHIDGVFILGDRRTLRVLYASPAYERIIGGSLATLYANPESAFDAIHPDDRAPVLAAHGADLPGPVEREYRVVHPDGSVRWIADRLSPIRDASGASVRVALFAQDVTQRKQLEEQLRQSQKMEAVGRLAGGVAHDFNNLLTVIGGAAHLLGEGLPPDAPHRETVTEILAATERAGELTRRLLAFGRRQVLQLVVLDLNRVLTGLEKMLRRLIGEDIELTVELAPHGTCVRADPIQIEQVVMNLVVNARDAMPEGGRLVLRTEEVALAADGVRQDPERALGRYVRLTVSDTGLGMDAETRRRAFEPFFTTKEPGRGTGLGLSTVYGIVRQSGGHVRARSLPGQGTAFEVDLPLVEPTSVAALEPLPEDEVRGGAETLLLAEDEDAVRGFARRSLESRGYRVLEARDGEEALAGAEAHPGAIDLLVTDVVMPRLGGFDLARRLTERRPGLRVLYVSGYPEDRTGEIHALGSGASLLLKPFRGEDLARRVRELLDGE